MPAPVSMIYPQEKKKYILNIADFMTGRHNRGDFHFIKRYILTKSGKIIITNTLHLRFRKCSGPGAKIFDYDYTGLGGRSFM